MQKNKVKFNGMTFLAVSAVAMLLCSNVLICNAHIPNNNSMIETQVDKTTILNSIKSITTDSLIIALTTPKDIADLAKYFKSKYIQDTFGVGRELSESEAQETLKLISYNSSLLDLMKIFTIKSLENEVIGQIWVSLKEGTENCIVIDSWIGKPFWGQAIVPEAVCALIEQINDPNINISFTLSSDNKKSERAVLKIGEKLGALIKGSKGEYIPQSSKTSKFYLKEKNIYRNIYTRVEGNDSQINFESYKNDELLFEQTISNDMLYDKLYTDISSIEYIFSKYKK